MIDIAAMIIVTAMIAIPETFFCPACRYEGSWDTLEPTSDGLVCPRCGHFAEYRDDNGYPGTSESGIVLCVVFFLEKQIDRPLLEQRTGHDPR